MSSVSFFIPKGCRFLFELLKYDTVDTSGIGEASSWFRVLQSDSTRGSVAFRVVSRGLSSHTVVFWISPLESWILLKYEMVLLK